jgi:hypothetical protein
VTLTSLLTWVFASSTANIQWLGSTAVTTTIASAQVQPGPNQNA